MGQGCTVALAVKVKVKVTCWGQGIDITRHTPVLCQNDGA